MSILRCAVVPVQSICEEIIFDADCGSFSALLLSEDGAFVSVLGNWKFGRPRRSEVLRWMPLDACWEASVPLDVDSVNCAAEELANEPG